MKGRIELGKRLYEQQSTNSVVRVSHNTIIKYGKHVNLEEAETMRFLTKHTTIPIPKVLSSCSSQGITYIEIEYVQGGTISETIASRDLETILDELHGYIEQLRGLKPSESIDQICSLRGGPLRDFRVSSSPFRPFSDSSDFHRFLCGGLSTEEYPLELKPAIGPHSLKCRSKFTHGDLTPRNIIIQNGKILSILDWSNSGWYPEYWEYRKAQHWRHASPMWREGISHMMKGLYNAELEGGAMPMEAFGIRRTCRRKGAKQVSRPFQSLTKALQSLLEPNTTKLRSV
jgi:serine/threonine protein kinase